MEPEGPSMNSEGKKECFILRDGKGTSPFI